MGVSGEMEGAACGRGDGSGRGRRGEGGNLMRASQFCIVGTKVALELLHFQPTI